MQWTVRLVHDAWPARPAPPRRAFAPVAPRQRRRASRRWRVRNACRAGQSGRVRHHHGRPIRWGDAKRLKPNSHRSGRFPCRHRREVFCTCFPGRCWCARWSATGSSWSVRSATAHTRGNTLDFQKVRHQAPVRPRPWPSSSKIFANRFDVGMLAIDTDVLVRLPSRNDTRQAFAADQAITSRPCKTPPSRMDASFFG